MAPFRGTKGDHRKSSSIGRTMKGQGRIGAKGAWEREIERSRPAGAPKNALERAFEQARSIDGGKASD